MFYFLYWVFVGLFCLNIMTYLATAAFMITERMYRPAAVAARAEARAKRLEKRTAKQRMKEELLAAKLAEDETKGKRLTRTELEYRVKSLEGELETRTEDYENQLEARRQSFEAELALVVGDNLSFKNLLSAISAAHKAQDGRLCMYTFKLEEDTPTYAVDCDGIGALITNGGQRSLRSALIELCATEAPVVGERRLAATCCSFDGNDVYVLADISDSFRADDAELALAELKQRVYEMDKLTDAMNFEAFVSTQEANGIDKAANKWLVLTQIEPVVISDEIAEGFGEAYPKMCAEILINMFGEGNVTRHSSDSLCFVFDAKDVDEAKSKVYEAMEATEARRREMWRVDDRLRGKTIWQLSKYNGSGLDRYIYCMDLRTRVDFQREEFGLRIFESEKVERVMTYKACFEETLKSKTVRFLYRPIAVAGTAKIFGYEMIPFFPKLPFETMDEILHWANIFGLINRLEEMVQFEFMRCYDRMLEEATVLGSMRMLISTFPGACMVSNTEDNYFEKYYDLLPAVISEITDRLPEDSKTAEIKCEHIGEWGMWSAVRCDEDIEKNSMKMGFVTPNMVRISIKSLSRAEKAEDIVTFIKFAHLHNALVMVDDISTVAELEKAVEIGADCLEGDCVGKPNEAITEISDKCIRKIGQLRFGKKRG